MNRSRTLLSLATAACAALALAAGPALASTGGSAPDGAGSAQATPKPSTTTKTTKTTKKTTKKPTGCTKKKCTTGKPTRTRSCKNPKKCGTTTSRPTTTTPGSTTPTTTTTTSPTTTPTTTTPTGPTPTPTLSDGPRAQGSLTGMVTAGRVKVNSTSWQFSWPGVAIEGAFTGTSVGVNIDDVGAFFDVQVDGVTVATLNAPSTSTHWITGLRDGTHLFRLVKRSESTWSTATFGGLVAGSGGSVIAVPRPFKNRQIEFIGDSYTAGYGDLSTSRSCTELNKLSNADVTFGALTARALGADYQLNAFSGRGMVRNYGGGEPGTSYRTYYDRALLADANDVWQRPLSWKPQVVVIGLGINDFSTTLNGNEAWANTAALTAAYRSAYKEFVAKLRGIYGPSTVIVASATAVYPGNEMGPNVQQVVTELNAAGDPNVKYWYYSDEGMDKLGCDWHPSAKDHQLIAQRLQDFLATLKLGW
ncbi:MAG: GDSL-type esterase/lipase family protein [Kineosporiaceae bacterium]